MKYDSYKNINLVCSLFLGDETKQSYLFGLMFIGDVDFQSLIKGAVDLVRPLVVRWCVRASVRPPCKMCFCTIHRQNEPKGGTYGRTNGCSNGRTNGHMTQMGGRTEAPSHKSISCLKIKDDQKEEDQKEDGQN